MTKSSDRNRTVKYFLLGFIVLFCWILFGTAAVHADNAPKGKIVMSVEKSTIGQRFIMEPQYVDFYEGDTLATVTLRELTRIGRRYNYDGRTTHGFYLSEISDPNRGSIKVPDYLMNVINKSGYKFYEKDFTPEYLGEKDYCSQSGWVYDYNGVQPQVSACDVTPKDGDVLQWKFTLATLGKDVEGDIDKSSTRPDRVKLNKLLAEVRKQPELLKNSEVKNAYDRCLALTVDLNTTKSELTVHMNTLRKALSWNTISDIHIWGSQGKKIAVKNGTEQKDIEFPTLLRAYKSGSTSQINIPVSSWICDDKYDPSKAGNYQFYPVIPDAYVVDENAELPAFTVQVREFGDVNKDDSVNTADIEEMMSTTNAYFGKKFESDEGGAVYDLNNDGIVDMQDYSLLVGAVNNTEIRSEDEGRLVLKFAKSDCVASEETTAELMLYCGKLDTVGIQLNTSGIQQGIKLKCNKDFQIEYSKENENGIFLMLGRRQGAVSAQNLQGISIGTLTFTCKTGGDPALSFGKAVENISYDQSVLGYRNGYKVTFDTSVNYGKDTRFAFQLNNGNVRTGKISDDEITEDGVTMKEVQVTFRASDAEDAKENRVRVLAQLPEEYTLQIGGSLKNGEITDPLTQESDGLYYAKGTAGCLTGGQSAQRESCVLYGVLTDGTNKTYYKFNIDRKGYKKTTWNYTGSNPFVLNTWSESNPEILSGKWSAKDAGITGWDADGNPMTDLHVVMPNSDASQSLYYKEDSNGEGTLYAKEAGDYWLEIQDSTGEVRGKIRVLATYPYDAAAYFVKKAQEISMDSADYNASVADQLFVYRDMINKVNKIQDKYPENLPIYITGLGGLTLEETGNRASDSEGYKFFADSLRTDSVNELRQGIREIRPVLEKNKKSAGVVTPKPDNSTKKPAQTQQKKTVTFSGSDTISKEFAKKSFKLGIKVNSNGKVTYESSNKKVATVSASGKITMKSMGKTVITIKTAETSSYKAGTRRITLNLNPKKPQLKYLKSQKKKTAAVKWKKVKGISGYQIQYSISKNFKGAKTAKASKKAVSGTIKKLKSKKKYYVRIRTYKKAYGQTVYSSWSKVKKVKVK